MINRLLMAALAVLFASPSLSQSARVLSGEHGDFSRLAIVFEVDTPWVAGRTPDGYRVELKRTGVDLDFSQIFNLMPRDRIKAVTYDRALGQISISSDCACHLDVFDLRNNTLVIDLKDGLKPKSPFESLLIDSQERVVEEVVPPQPKREPSTNLLREVVQLPSPPEQMPPEASRDETSRLSANQATAERLSVNLGAQVQSDRTRELELELLQNLSRAGTQGLVELKLPTDRAEPDPKTPNTPSNVLETTPESTVNLHSETSFDRELSTRQPGLTAPQGQRCYAPSKVTVAAWGNDKPAKELLPELHSQLVTERDQPSDGILQAVAEGYIYLGFGAEARSYLAQRDSHTQTSFMLRALANIMDDSIVHSGVAFTGMMECSNPSALWSLLEAQTVNAKTSMDVVAIQRTFLELPAHLRRLLAPRVAERLSAAGQEEAAHAVLDSMKRAPGELRGQNSLAVVQSELRIGKTQEVLPALEDIVSENSDASVHALITLLETKLAEGKAPDQDTIDLAQALLVEIQGTEFESDLQAALSKALVATNNYDGGFNLARGNDGKGKSILPDVVDDLVSRVIDNASDSMFLETSFRHILSEQPETLADDTRKAFSDRLLALGFAEEAETTVVGMPWATDPALQETRARISLELERPEDAIRFIAGRNDAEAETIRAEANTAIDDLAQAAMSFAQAGLNEDAAAAAWLSGESAPIASFGNELQGSFLSATIPETVPGEESGAQASSVSRAVEALNAGRVSRNEGRTRVSQSENFRNAAQDLLNSQ